MKIILGIVTILLSFTALAEEDWTKRITPEITLKALALYRADPTNEDALGALSITTNFADKSPNLLVEIKEEYFPFKLGELDQNIQARFIGAFVAGNIEYQLIHNINENRPIEGIKLVLYTYTRLREKNIIPKHKEFEKWINMDRNGELAKKIKI